MRRFTHEITVPASAIDVRDHASNIEYVRWIQDAAMAHSQAVGLGEAEYAALGGVFVVRRHQIEYLREARLGERLTVATWVASAKRVQCERGTEITNARGEPVATAVTTWVYVARDTMRPARIPEGVRQRFGWGSTP